MDFPADPIAEDENAGDEVEAQDQGPVGDPEIEEDLGVEVAWTEDQAKTTRGNARGVARLMAERAST